jgi:peroxiredoxin
MITSMRKLKNYLFAVLALILASFTIVPGNGGLPVGKAAPSFSINDVNGKPVQLSDYKGKLVLIDFWASWCKQCRIESPKLVKTYQKFHNANFDAGSGFEIISVSLDDDTAEWKTAITQDGYTWANVSEGKKWDAQIAKSYMVTSLPTNYLIDGSGKIIEKDLRGQTLENVLLSHKK